MSTYWNYVNSANHQYVMEQLRRNGYSLAADAMECDRVAVSNETVAFWKAREAGAKRQFMLDM